MVKIKIEKIQLLNGKFSVHFFSEVSPDALKIISNNNLAVDLSRTEHHYMYRVDKLEEHNHDASMSHTKQTVDDYIKRVITDITIELAKFGLTTEEEIEKVRGIFLPLFVTPGMFETLGKN